MILVSRSSVLGARYWSERSGDPENSGILNPQCCSLNVIPKRSLQLPVELKCLIFGCEIGDTRYLMSRYPRPIFVLSVFPVEAGVYKNSELRYFSTWIPAFAGMTFVT